MHPYAIRGPTRRIAYLMTLGLAACGATAAAATMGAWSVVPAFLLGYGVVFTTHQRWCWRWRWLRRVHRVGDLTGSWYLEGNRVDIRQTWTHLRLVGRVDGLEVESRMAEWRVDLEAPVLDVLASCPDGQLVPLRVRLCADATLSLQAVPMVALRALPVGAWRKVLPSGGGTA